MKSGKINKIQSPNKLIIIGEDHTIVDAKNGTLSVFHLYDADVIGPPPDDDEDETEKFRAKATANINFRNAPTSSGQTQVGVVMKDTEFWVLDKTTTNGYLLVMLDDEQEGWLFEISNGQRLIAYI